MNAIVVTAVGRRPKQAILLLLLFLLLISYALLTLLVVRQNKTINSQRSLIHLLFKDNLHLAKKTSPGVGVYGKMQAQAQNQTSSAEIPSNQIPSSQVPSIQVPPLQVPSGKANPRAGMKPGRKSRNSEKALPLRPPAELTDPSDMRRVSFAI
jgi:hypothetical protein